MKKDKRRLSKTTSIKDLTSKYFADNELGSKLLEKRIENTWNKIMDRFIIERTDGLYAKNLIVFIKINSSPLKNELRISKEKILIKLKKHHNNIKDVVFL